MRLYRLSAGQLTAEEEEAVRNKLPERYERTARYLREESKKQCIGAGALLLRAFRDRAGEILLTPEGKPYFEKGPAFSLSHSSDEVLLAVGDEKETAVGADVERIRPVQEAVRRRVLTEEERVWVEAVPGETDERFAKLWTIKESILKCTGEGLTVPMEEICALPAVEGRPVPARGQRFLVRTGVNRGFAIATAELLPAEKKTRPILFGLVQWTYGILQNLLGAVVFACTKLIHPTAETGRFRECVTLRTRWSGSMSLGTFLFIGKYGKSEEAYVLAHEYGHSIQSLILGPLYLPVIGLPSFLRANLPVFSKNWKSGKKDYYDFYPERWANRLGRPEAARRIASAGEPLRF